MFVYLAYMSYIGYKIIPVDNLKCTLNKLPGSFFIIGSLRISFVSYPVLSRLIGNPV